MRAAGVLVSESRAMLMRVMAINHLVHHREQLGMYLRLLNVPMPGIAGRRQWTGLLARGLQGLTTRVLDNLLG
jgi:uncharacterized damage-inducible protein DinB